MSHLLDTNAFVDHLRRGPASNVTAKLSAAQPGSVYLCAVVVAELYYGAMHSGPAHQAPNLALVAKLRQQFDARGNRLGESLDTGDPQHDRAEPSSGPCVGRLAMNCPDHPIRDAAVNFHCGQVLKSKPDHAEAKAQRGRAQAELK